MSLYSTAAGVVTLSSSWGVFDTHNDGGHVSDPDVVVVDQDLAAYATVVSLTAATTSITTNAASIGTINTSIADLDNAVGEVQQILEHSDTTKLAHATLEANVLVPFSASNTVIASNLQVIEGASAPANGTPSGLLFTKGAVSESLNLLEDARVVMEPTATSLYRFGAVDAQTGADRDTHDGLHLYTSVALDGSGDREVAQPNLNEIVVKVCKSKPSLYIRSVKNVDVPILEIVNASETVQMKLSHGGCQLVPCTVQSNVGASDSDATWQCNDDAGLSTCSVTNDGSLTTYAHNPFRRPFKTARSGPVISLHQTGASTSFLECKDNSDVLRLTIRSDGHVDHHNVILAPGVQPVGHAPMTDSAGVGDNSLYVGSTRLSYNRSLHRMEYHRLKLSHIPLYLQGRNFTSNDLPANHATNDMSVMKWIEHAKAQVPVGAVGR